MRYEFNNTGKGEDHHITYHLSPILSYSILSCLKHIYIYTYIYIYIHVFM